uniref:Uncharacterized protein n=1 Tax=Arundo donax TaxID=35708 RepID=A0A0A9FFK9_ARUDO
MLHLRWEYLPMPIHG